MERWAGKGSPHSNSVALSALTQGPKLKSSVPTRALSRREPKMRPLLTPLKSHARRSIGEDEFLPKHTVPSPPIALKAAQPYSLGTLESVRDKGTDMDQAVSDAAGNQKEEARYSTAMDGKKAKAGSMIIAKKTALSDTGVTLVLSPSAPETVVSDLKHILYGMGSTDVVWQANLGTITANVPADRFDKLMSKIARMGEIKIFSTPPQEAKTIFISINIDASKGMPASSPAPDQMKGFQK